MPWRALYGTLSTMDSGSIGASPHHVSSRSVGGMSLGHKGGRGLKEMVVTFGIWIG